MTYSGTMMKDLTLRTEQVCERSDNEQAERRRIARRRRDDLRSENRAVLRGCLFNVASRILDRTANAIAPEPLIALFAWLKKL